MTFGLQEAFDDESIGSSHRHKYPTLPLEGLTTVQAQQIVNYHNVAGLPAELNFVEPVGGTDCFEVFNGDSSAITEEGIAR
jgi:hypothetical protein